MRIVCPACAATYDVPDGRLLPGRVVRCARCETDWAPVAEVAAEPAPPEAKAVAPEPVPGPEPVQEAPAVEEEPAPEVVPAAVLPPAPSRKRQGIALKVAWALSVAVLLAAVWLGYSAREAVMHAWPPSVRAYAALGLAAKH